MPARKKLNSKNMKQVLWDTMLDVREGSMQADQAKAISQTAREVLRTVNIETKVFGSGKIDFVEE